MSSLEAISGFKLEIDIVQNIIKDYTHLAISSLNPLIASKLDTESEKIIKFYSLLQRMRESASEIAYSSAYFTIVMWS